MIQILLIKIMFLTMSSAYAGCNQPATAVVSEPDLSASTKGGNELPRTSSEMIQDRAGNFWFCDHKGVLLFNGKSFHHFTDKDGLSHTAVFTILEDRDGIIWFGTADGITRYDGKTFKVIPISLIKGNPGTYTKTKLDNFGVPHPVQNFVLSILQDSKGVFWFGTSDGLYNYDPSKGHVMSFNVFRAFPHNNNLGASPGYLGVEGIVEDGSGDIWFGGRGMKGVFRFNRVSGTLLSLQPDGDNWVRPVISDSEGDVWFSNLRGVYRYSHKLASEKESAFNSFQEKGFTDWVFSMAEDKEGNIWFSMGIRPAIPFLNTIVYFHRSSGLLKYQQPEKGACADVGRSVTADKSGNIWLRTKANSLCRYDGSNFTEITR